MRIKVVHIAGLAAALFGGVSKEAAADTTINTATTAPLQTNTAGNVTITSGGSITVTAGQTAVTANSPLANNNSVTNAGQISSTDADNSIGILLGNGVGDATTTINSSNTINLGETYTITDIDSDGDLDGTFAMGTNRYGIYLGPGATFTGDIINSGVISIKGQNSAGIDLNALLTGDLTTSGTISITGENSQGIAINGGLTAGVTGDVFARGSVSVTGQNDVGLLVNAPIGGQLRINGTWVDTGFHSATPPSDLSHLDADDLLQSGADIAIHYSVAGGVTIEGIGVEDDVDDDGDGVTEADGDTNDDLTASVTSLGGAPAILVQADPSADLSLGMNSNGFGLQVQGTVAGLGIYDGVVSHAISVMGSGGRTATVDGGIALDFLVSSLANGADAYGLYIGNDGSTPQVLTRKQFTTTTVSDTATNAYALYFDAGANVPVYNNSGTVISQVFGETGSATVVTDRSNTLATIINSGTLQARVVATDDDPTDGIPPPPITGTSTAIDVSTSTIAVTFTQNPDTPFTDGDMVDDDALLRPTVQTIGDIKFGSGADTVNLLAGTITGDISFGAGADAMTVDNGGIYSGRITDSDGALTLNVVDGTLALQGGATNITSATFGANSQFGALLSETPGDSTLLVSSGMITFDAGARVVPLIPTGLPVSSSHTFLTANGGLIGASNVTGVVAGNNVPYVYNLSVDVVSGDPNSLEANFILKTTAELGLGTNQAAAFNPILNALRTDADASSAFSLLDTEQEFRTAYGELMPSYSSASTELATTAIQQQQSATTNRLSTTRLRDLNEVSAWAQEIGYVLTRDPPDINGDQFRGHGFGLALGIDGPLNNGALFGLSASFLSSEAEEPIRPEGEISSSFGQGNAYLGTAWGNIDLDFVGGLGVGKIQERRFVSFGTFSAEADAEWWAYEGHAMARASAPMRVSNWLVMTPQASLTYVGLEEDGYTEEGGGTAIDMKAEGAFSQRLWADLGVEFSGRLNLRGDSIFAPRLYLGYRANALNDATDRKFQFISTGDSFTLSDDDVGSGGALVGIGIDATNGYSTFSLSYEGEFSDQIDRHSLNLALRYRF